jgi:hypothetical protein
MEVLIKPLYAITSVGLEDNLIDAVVMRMILQKAQEQQELQLQNLEALSHFKNVVDFDDQNGVDNWNNFRNVA